MILDPKQIDKVVLNALEEDMPYGDVTTDNLISLEDQSKARFIAKADGVLSGMTVMKRVFELIDADVSVEIYFEDGSKVKKGDIVAHVAGRTGSILKGERTALNLLQHLSGVATRTNNFAELVKEYPVSVVDTRKTLPGLRSLQKYAVTCGGGRNHRYNLSDCAMLKDNHIDAKGGITPAVKALREKIGHTVKIEVETRTLDEVREALSAGADIIMLDNMSNETMAEAVKIVDGKALLEASGNLTKERLRSVAELGVDILSIGALTHSVTAFDISMRMK